MLRIAPVVLRLICALVPSAALQVSPLQPTLLELSGAQPRAPATATSDVAGSASWPQGDELGAERPFALALSAAPVALRPTGHFALVLQAGSGERLARASMAGAVAPSPAAPPASSASLAPHALAPPAVHEPPPGIRHSFLLEVAAAPLPRVGLRHSERGVFLVSLNASGDASKAGNATWDMGGLEELFGEGGDLHNPMVVVLVVSLLVLVAVVLAWLATRRGYGSWAGTSAFFLATGAGLVFFVQGYYFDDWALMVSAFHLSSLSFICAVFIGGDPCMLDEFKAQLDRMHEDEDSLREGNIKLQDQVGKLQQVERDLKEAMERHGVSQDEFRKILRSIEKLVALETIANITEIFHLADSDRDGVVKGETETEMFLSAIEDLKERFPTFDWAHFKSHVSEGGIHFHDLVRIVKAFAVDDPLQASDALEDMLDSESESSRQRWMAKMQRMNAAAASTMKDASRKMTDASRSLGAASRSLPPQLFGRQGNGAGSPAQLEEHYDEAGGADDSLRVAGAQAKEVAHGVNDKVRQVPGDARALVRGAASSAWKAWLALALVSGLGCCFASMVLMSLPTLLCSFIGTSLAVGLWQAAPILDIVFELQAQVKVKKKEVSKLQKASDEMTKKVSRLDKLRVGFDELNQRFDGDLNRAHADLHRMEVDVKQELVTAITQFFIDADKDHSNSLEDAEIDEFVELLSVFKDQGIRNLDSVRADLRKNGLTPKEFTSLIDRILEPVFNSPSAIQRRSSLGRRSPSGSKGWFGL